jgi:hypothetical protein
MAAVAVAAGVALGATACSVSVSKTDLETNVASTLTQQIPGLGPVTCPGDLAGEVGATITCETTTSDGQPIGAVVTVTSVDGSTVNYNVETEARPVSQDLLAKKVQELVEPQLGVPVDSLTCDGALQPTMGATQTCAVAAAGNNIPLKVTVTNVDGGLINFSVEEA